MYYALILLSVVIFGGCFALNDVYRRQRGSSLRISLEFSFISSAAGLVVLLAVNGFRVEFTWFTLLMAVLSALNSFGFTFCSFRSLGLINLSLYSLFSMLGGMLLPFAQGILFYGESITVAKAVCFVLICAALALTVEKGERSKGAVYYAGVFILNGMSGVLSKLFTSAAYAKTSAAGYSILGAMCCTVISAVLLLTLFRGQPQQGRASLASVGVGALGGAANRVANYLLLIALAHVDASVQYPMVTGGVMIVSTLICFCGANKPSKKEQLSVVIAFLGMLALFLIPV